VSDYTELYLVAVALYFYEGLLKLTSDSFVFKRSFLGSWGPWQSFDLRSSVTIAGKYIVLAGPIPTLSSVVTRTLPFSLTSDGVLAASRHGLGPSAGESSGHFRKWDQINTLEVDRQYILDSKGFSIDAGTNQRAQNFFEVLKSISSAEESVRTKKIDEFLLGHFDFDLAKQQFHTCTNQLRLEQLFNFWNAIFLLGLIPFFNRIYSIEIFWPWYLFFIFGFSFFNAAIHWKNAKALGSLSLERIFELAVFPLASTRSAQKLLSSQFGNFHPVTLAYCLLSNDEFKGFCQHVIRDLQYPRRMQIIDTHSNHDEVEFRKRMLSALRDQLKFKGIQMEDSKPEKSENLNGYCPRCMQQYSRSDGECADCVGVELLKT
jgi:hypothetical protein